MTHVNDHKYAALLIFAALTLLTTDFGDRLTTEGGDVLHT